MDPQNAHPAESRPPTLNDLVQICRSLNEQGARYAVVGGFAVNHHGFIRSTMDIDLLLDDALENQQRVKKALEILPDRAVCELGDEDLRKYLVVRVADEVVVDLMLTACGITFAVAQSEIQPAIIEGVAIPFVSARMLLRTKNTYREKDAADRLFLEHKIAADNA